MHIAEWNNYLVAECKVHPALVKSLPKDCCNEESVLLNVSAIWVGAGAVGRSTGGTTQAQPVASNCSGCHVSNEHLCHGKRVLEEIRGSSEYMKERGGEEGEREQERLAGRGRVFMHAQVRGLESNRLPPYPSPWFPKSHHTEAKQIYGCAWVYAGVHEQVQLYGSGHTHGRVWMHVCACAHPHAQHTSPSMKATWETSLPPKPQRCATNLVKLSCRWVISLWEKGKGEEGVSTYRATANGHLRLRPPPVLGQVQQGKFGKQGRRAWLQGNTLILFKEESSEPIHLRWGGENLEWHHRPQILTIVLPSKGPLHLAETSSEDKSLLLCSQKVTCSCPPTSPNQGMLTQKPQFWTMLQVVSGTLLHPSMLRNGSFHSGHNNACWEERSP